MELLRTAALLATALTTGFSAGMFYVFAHDVMPGLGRANDRTFVGGFQAIDRAILNPWFVLGYLGPLVFGGLAVVLHLGAEHRSVLLWLVITLVAYVPMLVVTARVHLPLNRRLGAAGDPDQISDLAGVREPFEERWVRWNLVRAVLTVLAFVGSLLALAAA